MEVVLKCKNDVCVCALSLNFTRWLITNSETWDFKNQWRASLQANLARSPQILLVSSVRAARKVSPIGRSKQWHIILSIVLILFRVSKTHLIVLDVTSLRGGHWGYPIPCNTVRKIGKYRKIVSKKRRNIDTAFMRKREKTLKRMPYQFYHRLTVRICLDRKVQWTVQHREGSSFTEYR